MLIRVGLVDSQRLFRQSVALMLNQESDIRVVGEASDGHEAFSLAMEKKPHIMLMDLDLPKLSTVNTIRLILGCCPKVKILILSVHHDNPHVSMGLEAGAAGYVLKDVDQHELVRIIRHYALGSPVSSAFLTSSEIIKPEAPPAPDTSTLTRREGEIMELLSRGQRSQEIADTLSISVETVKVHIQHIYRKMGVKNRVEMILLLKSLPSIPLRTPQQSTLNQV
ncbi:MAG: response regulator transcription factor [Gammaproteobacteria bacterium]|nr:response regulator transcription factor [Gammaproteobacteria bacterium]